MFQEKWALSREPLVRISYSDVLEVDHWQGSMYRDSLFERCVVGGI